MQTDAPAAALPKTGVSPHAALGRGHPLQDRPMVLPGAAQPLSCLSAGNCSATTRFFQRPQPVQWVRPEQQVASHLCQRITAISRRYPRSTCVCLSISTRSTNTDSWPSKRTLARHQFWVYFHVFLLLTAAVYCQSSDSVLPLVRCIEKFPSPTVWYFHKQTLAFPFLGPLHQL